MEKRCLKLQDGRLELTMITWESQSATPATLWKGITWNS